MIRAAVDWRDYNFVMPKDARMGNFGRPYAASKRTPVARARSLSHAAAPCMTNP
jgi:hypothetical protein